MITKYNDFISESYYSDGPPKNEIFKKVYNIGGKDINFYYNEYNSGGFQHTQSFFLFLLNRMVQNVDIEKNPRRITLESKNIPYAKLKDGAFDINGNLRLFEFNKISPTRFQNEFKIRLPFDFNIVRGSFECGYNRLSTMEGFPKKVGSLDIYGNNFTSLEGSPIVVTDYVCRHQFSRGDRILDKHFSLKGIQDHIYGDLNCSNNNMTSLEYCPVIINGRFNCSNNRLTNLEYCAKTIGNFDCSKNQITDLSNGPKHVKGNYYAVGNKITDIEGYPLCIIDGNLECFELTSNSQSRLRIFFSEVEKIVKSNKEKFIDLLDDKYKFHQQVLTLSTVDRLNNGKNNKIEEFYNESPFGKTIKLTKKVSLLI